MFIYAHYDTLHLHTFSILNSEDDLLSAQLEYETAKQNPRNDASNTAIHNVYTRIVATKSQRYESAKATVQRLNEEINALTKDKNNTHSNVNISSGEQNDGIHQGSNNDGEDGEVESSERSDESSSKSSDSSQSYHDEDSVSEELDYQKNVSHEDIDTVDKESTSIEDPSFDDAFL